MRLFVVASWLSFLVVQVYWGSFLKMYQLNNAHRQLDVAIAREKAYQATIPKDDEDDDQWMTGEAARYQVIVEVVGELRCPA